MHCCIDNPSFACTRLSNAGKKTALSLYAQNSGSSFYIKGTLLFREKKPTAHISYAGQMEMTRPRSMTKRHPAAQLA